MKHILQIISAAGIFIFAMFSMAQATPVTPESFNIGLNTGYSVTGTSSVDGNVDWFVFDANATDRISFWFDRMVAAPDLIAGLYRGDTTGFDYRAAGANSLYSHYNAAFYNPALTHIAHFDDSHDDSLRGPWGDPHFSLYLSAGRYSLALSSLGASGAYRLSVNIISEEITPTTHTPEPTSMLLLGTGLMGIAGFARSRKKKRA